MRENVMTKLKNISIGNIYENVVKAAFIGQNK